MHNDPYRQLHRPQRNALLRLPLVFLFFTAYLALFYILGLIPPHFFAPALFLLTAITIAIYLLISYSWRRRATRRKRALSGDPSLLANPQPSPNPYNLLPLPTTILLKPDFQRIRNNILRRVVMLVVIIALIGYFYYISPLPGILSLQTLSLFFFFLLFIPISYILRLRAARSASSQQIIHATEQGLTVTSRGKSSSITWEEARFFSISGGTASQLPVYYELSSERHSLLWMQVFPSTRLVSQSFTPTIPFEAYSNQMQALHAFITTRTHLPLYDLRAHNNPSPITITIGQQQ